MTAAVWLLIAFILTALFILSVSLYLQCRDIRREQEDRGAGLPPPPHRSSRTPLHDGISLSNKESEGGIDGTE